RRAGARTPPCHTDDHPAARGRALPYLDTTSRRLEGVHIVLSCEQSQEVDLGELLYPGRVGDGEVDPHHRGVPSPGRVRDTGDRAALLLGEVSGHVAVGEVLGKPPWLHDHHTTGTSVQSEALHRGVQLLLVPGVADGSEHGRDCLEGPAEGEGTQVL